MENNTTKLNDKLDVLNRVAAELKTEFFGIDEQIDRIIDLMKGWYCMPEIVTRPVIVNLWGMTGVGKTDLVRKLVKKLNLLKNYVEISMDGGSAQQNGGGNSSIFSVLEMSDFDAQQANIILFDEFQKFQTKEGGKRVDNDMFRDFWTFLSDGTFGYSMQNIQSSANLLAKNAKVSTMGFGLTSRGRPSDIVDEETFDYYCDTLTFLRRTKFTKKYKRTFKNVNDIVEKNITSLYEKSYKKTLVFIVGNLDNVYSVAGDTSDCDTNADYFHEMTKKISLIDVKSGLERMFFPEQIARLGSNHVIYPALSRAAYEKLIQRLFKTEVIELFGKHSVVASSAPKLLDIVYENTVFPTQGTRPVFSSFYSIFSTNVSNILFWAKTNGVTDIALSLDEKASKLVVTNTKKAQSVGFPVSLEIQDVKKRNSPDFNTLVAVHEAGHAIAQMEFLNEAPNEIKINIASFKGGYNLIDNLRLDSKETMLKTVRVLWAGTVAEQVVFGHSWNSSGNGSDLEHASSIISAYIRDHAFGKFKSLVTEPGMGGVFANHDVDGTNKLLDSMMKKEYENTLAFFSLKSTKAALKTISEQLLSKNKLTKDEFLSIIGDKFKVVPKPDDASHPYAETFKSWSP